MSNDSQPWYAEGLQFSCTRCGNCCGGAPGYCWVSEDEIVALAQRLGMSVEAFRTRYTRHIKGRGISLQEKRNYDCVFFERGRGCSVYEDRPRQCRTWPFWQPNLASREDWQEASAGCPGMDQGERHDVGTIIAIASDDGLPR
ncbi:MAG: YkgJ family cysteine cluster protein [Planctomycetota bacterium]|nr:MAG: YkgJ family cysteine cluster protein [Planctomycetota bacterium]